MFVFVGDVLAHADVGKIEGALPFVSGSYTDPDYAGYPDVSSVITSVIE